MLPNFSCRHARWSPHCVQAMLALLLTPRFLLLAATEGVWHRRVITAAGFNWRSEKMRLSPGSFNHRNSEVWWTCRRSAVSIIDTSDEQHSHAVLFGRSLTLHPAVASLKKIWHRRSVEIETKRTSSGRNFTTAKFRQATGRLTVAWVLVGCILWSDVGVQKDFDLPRFAKYEQPVGCSSAVLSAERVAARRRSYTDDAQYCANLNSTR